ncbi:MAG: AI-2E family transporter [Planctomycetota bacterium]|nr:AI-2E family transporter [Planctomycetota bacterium]
MAQDDISPKSSRLIAMGSVCVVVAALYFARDVLVPLCVAVLLTFLLAPLVHRVERMRVPRVLAVLVVVGLALVVIGGLGWVISNQATELAQRLSNYQADIEQKVKVLRGRFGHGALARASQTLDNMARDVASSQPSETGGSAASQMGRGTPQNPVSVAITPTASVSENAFRVLGDALVILAPMAEALIVVVLVIFMLIQREDLRDRLIRLVGHGQLTLTTQVLDDAATRVSRYLLAQSLINSAYGIVVGVGLYLVHIPNAPLWGLLCALLRFIPYLGIWIGALFPIVLSFVVPEGSFALRPILTIGIFVVLELVTANAIEPLLFSSSTGVSSLAILVAAVFWTWLWGGVGLLLSTPLTVVLAVLGKYVPQMAFLDILLGDEPVLKPFERYYQRLLADDAEEAEDLIEEFGETKNTQQLYTEILMPALQSSERDFRRGMVDDQRRDFIRQTMADQIELRRQRLEIAEEKEEKASNSLTPGTAATSAPSSTPAQPSFKVPKSCVVNVLCLPANDKADEIAANMLVHLLEEQRYCASSVTADVLASEMVEAVEKFQANVVVISALPPAALSHARYLCKRLHAKATGVQMVVGLWGFKGDISKARERIFCAGNMTICNDFEEALKAIHQMVQPALIRASDEQASRSHEAVAAPSITPSSLPRRP